MTSSADFQYADERFADIQLLRYRLNGFEKLSLRQKLYIYYLSKATLTGRDITTDQFGAYNIRIRKLLETLYQAYDGDRESDDFRALSTYLKRVWFSNGIYHHYGCEKLVPAFTPQYLWELMQRVDARALLQGPYTSLEQMKAELFPVIFDPQVLPRRVTKADGVDLVRSSACNYYAGLTQHEAEDFYREMKSHAGTEAPSFGLNSQLVKHDGVIAERKWYADGMYGTVIKEIVRHLAEARQYAENERQQRVIDLLIAYYETGDLSLFDQYSIAWIQETEGQVDFINGFIEVYGDPLGMKGSWEGIVEYKDLEATRRTRLISDNAQWFEDHSPVDSCYRKPHVKGITAHVICAAMLGGDEYPSSAIGINLPNADWIRARYGSKSVTIGNLTEAYDMASRNSGFYEEFVIDTPTLASIKKYGNLCDDLHTDLHECLGHGSGLTRTGVNLSMLKAYGNTIEEARADLFGLYYLADDKLLALGLLPDKEAYRAQYYSYMMNGLLTQLTRIRPGQQIEEDHMRNRALIAHWVLANCPDVVQLVHDGGKTFVKISDYARLRTAFARLLREIQRVKSEGDYEAAKNLVETYAVKVDADLHREVLERYSHLHLAPYKGFINPRLTPVKDNQGDIVDISVDYQESYEHQMLRYSREYGFL